jgi:GH15 family glucan-1,4-alpha-glucosidase
MHGQFTHTIATFLDAYAAIARAPVDEPLATRARRQARTVSETLERFWLPDCGTYALGRVDGELDERLDGSTLALLSAHRQYAAIEPIDDRRLDRLVSHTEATLSGLTRNPTGPVEGLVRFEGDDWRVRSQESPKIWTVTTAWGAHAALELAGLLADAGRAESAARFENWAGQLHAICSPGGPLRHDGGYLPEQFFDDGTPDSATPLGWPHAIRLATAARLDAGE